MPLSETNQIQLSMILNQTLLDVQLQLNYLGARFTTAVQTQIEMLITTWNTTGYGVYSCMANDNHCGRWRFTIISSR